MSGNKSDLTPIVLLIIVELLMLGLIFAAFFKWLNCQSVS